MTDAVLALNAGSSSLKLALFEAGAGDPQPGEPRPVFRGGIEGIGAEPRLLVRDADDATIEDRRWPEGTPHGQLLHDLLDWTGGRLGGRPLAAIGHRVVHGGSTFTGPVRVDDAVLAAIEALTPLAPLHQPDSVAAIRACRALRPEVPQVASFDTAFHHTIEAPASLYALPRRHGTLRKYGFHGLSYEFVSGRLRDLLPDAGGRAVVAHLGSGASLCAMREGRSLDTTMGLTALDGLVMGTRVGAVDPGVLLYLLRQEGLSAEALEGMLYRQAGLLGLSGVSADMRELLASPDPQAAAAVELFCFRAARETAALATTLGGLDTLVFAGGIGEHAPEVRARICARLAWLGVACDEGANARGEARIGAAGSPVEVRVIPTDEEIVLARHALAVLAGPAP